ncbi:MAG: S8 family serine peptidase [Candidatus Buchananbacteria bacterium]|nr:S8 family serine peptidase [Candidatus Buchananbacteria bacterium]
MKIKRVLKFFLIFQLCFFQLNFLLLPTSAVTNNEQTNSDFKTNEWLVKFKNIESVKKIKLTDKITHQEFLDQLPAGLVDYVEPNYSFKISAFPDDPYYQKQNYFNLINAKQAWSKELLTREVESINSQSVIAILDTGVDINHPDLENQIWVNRKEKKGNSLDDDHNGYVDDVSGWDFVSNDNNPNPEIIPNANPDAVSHGTIVAGIAAAASHNNQGITGISWNSKIMPLRVLNSDGYGDVYDVVRAIDYAVKNGANVINMSFFGVSFSLTLHDAIQRAYDAGVVLVAAAGNTDPQVNGFNLSLVKSYPVCYDGVDGKNLVIGVASVSSNYKKSDFSNYGNCIDIVAPGELFYSTQLYSPQNSGFEAYYGGYWSGTSLSTPLVSGVFAALKALRPELSVADLEAIVLGTAKNINSYNPDYKNELGSGLLNYSAAVDAAIARKIPGLESKYVVVGLGFGSFPQVRLLDSKGKLFKEFFAYSPYFKGPINVAAGDVNGDGKAEIITGAGFGGGPHVRVFNVDGIVLSQFFAADAKLRNGINIAVGDINGDGKAEIITGAGKGSKPEVKIFDNQGHVLSSFLAYDQKYLGGVNVAVGDIDGDGKAKIITGTGPGDKPEIKVFRTNGSVVSQFFPFNEQYSGGLNIAVGDVNADGRDEIVVGVESKSFATVAAFTYIGVKLSSFIAYDPPFVNGVNLAVGDLDSDGVAEIITGKNVGGSALVKVFDLNGLEKFKFESYRGSYTGGARLSVVNP